MPGALEGPIGFESPSLVSIFLIPLKWELTRIHESFQFEREKIRVSHQFFFPPAGGASATAASLVRKRKVNVSCRYKRIAVSVWSR
jgi:hypothetical protein